jgi:UDP-N-acetylmuramate dehydrogenase
LKKKRLLNSLGVPVREDVILAEYTSFNIGGPAFAFAEIEDVDSLVKVLGRADEAGLPTLILGGGTNLLVSDRGFDGLVAHLKLKDIQLDVENSVARVGAGVSTSTLVERLIAAGLSGLEFAAGLPGTIGGAIAGNAGCFGHTLSDFLLSALVVEPDGETREIRDPSWFRFDYRQSDLAKRKAVLVEAVFGLRPGDKADLQREAGEYLKVRTEKHPPKGTRTAGSYFKNLPPLSPGGPRRAAGALLDQAGAHGLSVGDAAVFERHANIIVNRGRATAKDVLTLAKEMAGRVFDRFQVKLEEEVRFVGERPE